MSEVILEIKDLKKYFPLANGKTVKAVDGVSMKMYKGETLGLVGESGCGKSTIAYTVVGMYGATSGQVIYDNMDIVKKGYRRTLKQKGDIQIVFQDPGSSLNSRRTIEKSMEVPLDIHDKMSKEEKEKRVEELLEMVGLPKDYKNKMPRNIGGGERQLVSVARALATNPELIILDEPTVGLDPKQINEIRDLIKGLKQKHTVILSSHILSEVSAVCDYVLIISHGKLVASDTPENLGKLAAGSNNLNLLVKGQKDTIRAALEAVEGVKEVTVKKSPEEGVYAITVGTEENMDVREKVFYSMVNAGCPILEMQSKKVSLEEIFLELTESEKKDKDASGKKSGKSFFKTAADAEKYLNEKNEDTVPDNGLEEKEFDESGEVSNDVSDNGLSGDKQDSFAASEKEKGEE